MKQLFSFSLDLIANVESFSKATLYVQVPSRSLDATIPDGHDASAVLSLAADRTD